MESKIIWLRISYWIAAIADFGIALSALFPERMGLTEYVYPMGLVAAVAFSWGILLIIADKKPVERRWILIPTMIVVALLTIVRVYAAYIGLIAFSWALLLFGVGLLAIMIYSYVITRAH